MTSDWLLHGGLLHNMFIIWNNKHDKKWRKRSLSGIYWLSCYPKLTSVNRQNIPVKHLRSTHSNSMKSWTKSGLLAALFLAQKFPFCFLLWLTWRLFSWNGTCFETSSLPHFSLPTHASPFPPSYPSPPARPTSNPLYGGLPVIMANFLNPNSFWWGRL